MPFSRGSLLLFLTGALAAAAPAQDDSARELQQLLQKLVGKDPAQSRFAEHLLIQEGGRAVPLLLPLLRDPDRNRRLRVVQMLGRIGEAAAAAKKALDGMLTTKDLTLQKATAISLLRIDPLHDPAIDLLAGRDDVLSKLSFCSCLTNSGKKGLPHLMRLARDRSRAVRSRADEGLRVVVKSGDLDQRHLMDILALGKHGPCKEAALALAELGKVAGPAFLGMLDSKDRVVRQAGLAGLAAMKDPPVAAADRARTLLRRCRKNRTPFRTSQGSLRHVTRAHPLGIRERETDEVIRYLGNLSPEPPWLIEELVQLLDTHFYCHIVARSEIKAHSELAMRWSRKQAHSTEWQQRRSAARVLAHVTVAASGDAAIILLVKLLQDPQADVRATAAISLAWHASHADVAYQELRIALRDRDPKVRAHAAAVFGAMGRKQNLPEQGLPMKELVPLLADKDAAVRGCAVMALSSQTLPKTSPIIETWIRLLHDPDHHVRFSAFFALRRQLLEEELTPDQTRRAFVLALTMLDEIHRRTARAGLRGKDLLLDELLNHDNPKVRREAAWALGEMGTDAKKHLPKVRKMLEDPDKRVRAAARFALRQVNPPKRKPVIGRKGPGTRRLKDVLK